MSSQFVSGGSDLFYLFIFAIWLRRDTEHKREKSRCAQLLAAVLPAQHLLPGPAPGPMELDPSLGATLAPRAPGTGLVAPPDTCHIPGGDEVWMLTCRQVQPGCPVLGFHHTGCWPCQGLVAVSMRASWHAQPWGHSDPGSYRGLQDFTSLHDACSKQMPLSPPRLPPFLAPSLHLK